MKTKFEWSLSLIKMDLDSLSDSIYLAQGCVLTGEQRDLLDIIESKVEDLHEIIQKQL